MTPSPDLWLFFLLVFGVIVLPGMDMAYVASNALVGGLRAGAVAVAGIMAGGAVHVAVAATGIAALLTVWPAAFNLVLAAGSAYMLWVGWSILRAGAMSASAERGAALPAHRVFGRALLTCLLNPKAYAFTLAVFPAFVRPGPRPLALQAAWLALIVVGTQALVYGAVALAAAGSGRFSLAGRWIPRAAGTLLIAGAAVTLLLGWKPAQAQAAATPQAAVRDASHDFDFLLGDWHIDNRKRLVLLKGEDRWETFAAESHVRPLPAVGNRDDFEAPVWRPGEVGTTLRIYNPHTGLWSLYWLNNHGGGLDARRGELLPPVVGGFRGDDGVFEGDDQFQGRPIRVRYTWHRIDNDHVTWAQAFSPDAGKTWETNWTMAMTRHDPVADILAVEQHLCDGYLHGDTHILQRDLAEGFTLINGRGEIGTKAEDIAAARNGDIRYTRFENRDMQVRLLGHDTAIVTGITSLAGSGKNGKPFDGDVRFTDTFILQDGHWQLAAGQASSALPR